MWPCATSSEEEEEDEGDEEEEEEYNGTFKKTYSSEPEPKKGTSVKTI